MSAAAASPTPRACLEVPRRQRLSYREFVEEHARANRPVIVTDAISGWRALSRWSPEFFRAEFGAVETRIRGESMRVAEVVERILAADAGTPAPYLHTTSPGGKMQHLFPSLLDDVRPLPAYVHPNWLEDRYFPAALDERLHRGPQAELFLGGAGSRFSLHWDSLYFQVFAFQIFGTKLWYLFAPDQSERLYPRPDFHSASQIADVEHPDLERFPAFADAVCQRCLLAPGEMLFLPGGWWHTTRIHEPSISVSINTANAVNWARMARELCHNVGQRSPLLGPPLLAYLAALAAWKSLRDRIRGLPRD